MRRTSYVFSVADGDTRTLTSMQEVYAEAARAGVTKITTAVSLRYGYAEDDECVRWSAVAVRGENMVAAAKGHSQEEAVETALRNLGIVE